MVGRKALALPRTDTFIDIGCRDPVRISAFRFKDLFLIRKETHPMTEQDREKINDVVADALALDADARPAFLLRAGLTEQELAEARSLLSVADGAASILDAPALEFSKDFLVETDTESLTGKTIGPFTIIRELGHGGMGAVYLASRKVGDKDQLLALKLLKREMNSSLFRQRFEQEREILATLNHPNISSLVDFGAAEDGTPYFAMEYVDGLPIDEFCSRNKYGCDDRLSLFQKVCSAVSSAHRSLVVHRDLKPSNILVTSDGTPKLLDFGISKILSSAEGQDEAATVTRLGAMTPGYASPEQLNGESVTTATDIYSLGVILFELLSGHRPFEEKERDLNRILRAVAEDDPPPPSSKADTGQIAEKRVPLSSEDRPDEARTLPNPVRLETGRESVKEKGPITALRPQEIRGDLDRIVLKSLQKEPERRYLSVDAFSEDIGRFREGRPVTARPSSLLYRTGKFLRRNRPMAIVGALLALAIVAGIIATLWQARVAATERARAERRLADVRELANSFLYEITPEIERLPGSTPAKVKLVSRALEYLNRLSADPNAGSDPEILRETARAYHMVGDVQGNPMAPNIGDSKGAKVSFQKALDIRLGLLERSPNDVALIAGLADDYQMLGLLESYGDDIEKAAPLLDRALELRKQVIAMDPADFEARRKLALTVRQRGYIPFYDGDNKAAIEYYRQSLDLFERLHAEQSDNDDVALDLYYCYVNIGEAQGWDGEYKTAAESIDKGLGPIETIAARHPLDRTFQRTLGLAYSKRADSHADLEEYDRGVAMFGKALEVAKKTSEGDPTDLMAKRDLALAYKKLGECQENAKQLDASLLSIESALAVFSELRAADPNRAEAAYDVANTTFSLGMTLTTMKRYAEARKNLENARDAFAEVIKTNPANTYARRMSAHTFIELAKALAGQNADKAAIAQPWRLALDTFDGLKAEGKFEKVDDLAYADLQKKLGIF